MYMQKIFFLCLFIGNTFFSSSAISQKDWNVEVDGKVTNDDIPLEGAVISLLKNSSQTDRATTSGDGSFRLTLSADNDYLIVISKEGHVSKKINFSTKNVPENKVGTGFPPFPIEVSIFEKIDGLDISILDEPIGKIAYYKKGNNFDYDEKYTASIQARLQKLKDDLKAKRKESKMKTERATGQDTTIKKPPAEGKKVVTPIKTKTQVDERSPLGEKTPRTANDYLLRGDIKGESGDYDAAINDYNKAIEMDPALEGAYLSRGAISFILQDFQSALTDCNKAIELSQEKIDSYYNRARVKTILEDHKGATHEYNKAGELKPTLAKAYYVRGNVKYFLGDKEDGCSDLIKAGELGYLKAYTYIKQYCQ